MMTLVSNTRAPHGVSTGLITQTRSINTFSKNRKTPQDRGVMIPKRKAPSTSGTTTNQSAHRNPKQSKTTYTARNKPVVKKAPKKPVAKKTKKAGRQMKVKTKSAPKRVVKKPNTHAGRPSRLNT